jgi:serine/threonine-protein kinase
VTTVICMNCGGGHASGSCPGVGAAQDSLALSPAGEVLLPTQTLQPGARVGEYQVTGLLGQGGMGVVYSGVHPLLGRKVAIKVLNHHVAHAEAAARFLQEARAASRLRHPNIVDVFAFGQMFDGHYYQVMELLEGESLRAVLHRDGALTLAQARAVIVGVLSALGAAHRTGIVHRDIKPDNIFLCAPIAALAAGDVKILDFGLAKNESGADTSIKTRTGMTMGTPAYMSPEQCRALPDIDARADIYAAGIVLYEMLAGHAPFQSDTAFDVMNMQISVPAPRLGQATGRDEPLEQVILQAMEKRPAARFDTAEEMLAAIDGALPPGAVADHAASQVASGPRRSPPRPATELANRPTLVAPGSDSAGAADGDEAQSTARVRREGRWSRAVVAAGLVLMALAAVVMLRGGSRTDRADDARPVAPAAAPEAIVPAPAALAPPAPAPLPASETARAGAPVESGETAAVRKQPAAVRAGRPHRRTAAAAGKSAARGAEIDLDSPLNPYAR